MRVKLERRFWQLSGPLIALGNYDSDLAGAIYDYVYGVLWAFEGDIALTAGIVGYFDSYFHALLSWQGEARGGDCDAGGRGVGSPGESSRIGDVFEGDSTCPAAPTEVKTTI